ncbi:hypothetical protein EJB05_01964 [Eragrostis curvula]|uniref:Uncharacterized protein n=1 Tax=Eragrostis curvula TaxID=38414 RepID=A0A5J9WRN5_9POAL|nr:hypothetical protein EJB05_01964 [Eragrostis curvula]
MEIPAAGARTRGARHRRTWAARYIRVSLGPGAGTTNRSAPVDKGGAGRVHGGARGVTLPFPRVVALVVITTSPLMRFGCRHAAAEMSCRADEWPRLMRTCAPRTNSKILHSGQFSKW